ncbi:hypothetical protein BD310DRAFT_601572 [Dichomitus squalens]|uniref:Uncharacterized protein n=1 Tax=Dichomitus squalens TaxID=114155 RepID=A0A4Q9PR22_9APHY|nr:hypothetical protein BD310DRAFT_601572 [Dichomitus squalens]
MVSIPLTWIAAAPASYLRLQTAQPPSVFFCAFLRSPDPPTERSMPGIHLLWRGAHVRSPRFHEATKRRVSAPPSSV